MTGFDRRQRQSLATPPEATRVQTREHDGRVLSYIEGWFAISEANRIFGHDGWDREMVHFERVFARHNPDGTVCGYLARVRVRVRARGTTILREGSGFGQASAPTPGEAHERALKAAETDATKRALATFGNPFGLSLYDRDSHQAAGRDETASAARPGGSGDVPAAQWRANAHAAAAGQRDGDGHAAAAASLNGGGDDAHAYSRPAAPSTSAPRLALATADGKICARPSPEGFCSGLRQLIELVRDRDELDGLVRANAASLAILRGLDSLRTPKGEHYAAILERLADARRHELGERSADGDEPVPADTDAAVSQPGPGEGARHAGADATASTVTDDAAAAPSNNVPAEPAPADNGDEALPAHDAPAAETPANGAAHSLSIRLYEPIPPYPMGEMFRQTLIRDAARALLPPRDDEEDGDGDGDHEDGDGDGEREDNDDRARLENGGEEHHASVEASRTGALASNDSDARPAEPAPANDATAAKAPTAANDASPAGGVAETREEQISGGESKAPAPASLHTRRSQITGRPSIDKSVLAMASERRIRSKAHLASVAGKACLVCEEMPCHAHHLTFAQPRGLSQKVSDEFTVPLCVAHHNELHLSGSEIAWWRRQGVDPLAAARKLWLETCEADAESAP